MQKLVAMLRVKDGRAFIGDWLDNIAPLVDEIVAVDNGSTDGTFEVLQSHPSVVSLDRTVGFDEGRDKTLLYAQARKRRPDWLLWLDVDETFESAVTRADLNRLMATTRYSRVFFRRFHFVDNEHFNLSWSWLCLSAGFDRIMWKEQPSGYFDNVPFNNGLVRGITGRARPCHMRLKHTGYIDASLVEQKISLYRGLDPSLEDTYQRMKFPDAYLVRWRERNEAPVRVALLDALLDAVYLGRILQRYGRRIISRLSTAFLSDARRAGTGI